MSDRHKEWSSEAEHELRRIVAEQKAEIRELERQLRAAKAEIRKPKRQPAAPVLTMRKEGTR